MSRTTFCSGVWKDRAGEYRLCSIDRGVYRLTYVDLYGLDGVEDISMKHELLDVAEPNLIREQFPYDAVPRIIFNGEFEKPDPAPDFFITDTTFRDGQQARPPYTAGQIVAMFDMLHRLRGPRGVIRQTEFFLYSKVDRDAVNRCLARGYKFPEVTGWIRAVKADFKIVKEMGLRETGILTSASDYHIFNKLKKTRRAAME